MLFGGMILDEEEQGILIDALIEHLSSSVSKKVINPESTSDIRSEICIRLLLEAKRDFS